MRRTPLYRAVLVCAYLGLTDLSGANCNGSDLSGANLAQVDLTDANLRDADCGGVNLGRADVSDANLRNVDLTGANLREATVSGSGLENTTLTGASLRDATLDGVRLDGGTLHRATFRNATMTDTSLADASGAGLSLREADLSGATLADADLPAVDCRGTDLTDADCRGARLGGGDLRESVLTDITVSQGTRCGAQTSAEETAADAEAWDGIARAYNDLKRAYSEAGLVGKARRQHVLERRARGFEARENGSLTGYVQFRDGAVPSVSPSEGNLGAYGAYVGSWVSRVTTGFGVRPFRLTVWMLVLFAVTAVAYELDPGIADPVYYSVVTFTTAPPVDSEPTIPLVGALALVETFGGTLLIVLLVYILGNRERF